MSTQIAPLYLLWEGETLLDAPIEEAWRHVVHYSSWQSYSIVQHVSGPAGGEGEIVLLKKEEGKAFPPYHARTLKLDPPRRVVWKVYPPEPIRGEGDFFGIVDFHLYEADGRTRFCYSSVHEYQVSYRDESELETRRRQMYADMAAFFDTVLPKLRKRVALGL